MPPCSDPSRLRALLDGDRAWTVYLLGDLDPEHWPHCQAWCGGNAVVVLYRRFATPVLLAHGSAEDVRPLLDEVPPERVLHLHLRPEIHAMVEERYAVPQVSRMIRMSLAPAEFRPRQAPQVVRLGDADAEELAALYQDGAATGESPNFYAAEMLATGAYFGLREAGQLVAVAGTHLLSRSESLAAVGNVYTRRDRRGRGLGAATTSAVVSALYDLGLRTVALSVKENNAAALAVYRRLGFREHCLFVEGRAVLR